MRTLTFNRVIGAGAMGSVYHAELRAPGGFVRVCAVKVMKASGPDGEQFMARMRDEARLLGMLQDESILGVADLVHVGERDAVIMDFVDGCDLSDLIRLKRVTPRALAELGSEIAGTLHRAHGAKHPSNGRPLNVIHRDIKPANVMITLRGSVKLLDFGVARAAFSDRESQTQGLVLGTLNYFPPEILAGAEPTQAVDIYGLGITLWECAAGKEWGSPQAQQQRFEKRVDQRLSELGPEYREIIPVLRSILQWDPKLRPDGGTVERSLQSVAGNAPGEGLRVWARDVVPVVLAERDKRVKDVKDDLVGKTLEVRGLPKDERSDVEVLDHAVPTPAPPPTAKAPPAKAPPAKAPQAKAPSKGKPRVQTTSGSILPLAVAGGVLALLLAGSLLLVVAIVVVIVLMQ